MENKDKIKKLLNLVKIKVQDESNFESQINSVVKMFDLLSRTKSHSDLEPRLKRRKVKLEELREDSTNTSEFKFKYHGQYFKVPNVSKK